MLNDLSLAFYTGDERFKKHVDMKIAIYDVMLLRTEVLLARTDFNTFKNLL